jgi:hypothetical protein
MSREIHCQVDVSSVSTWILEILWVIDITDNVLAQDIEVYAKTNGFGQ